MLKPILVGVAAPTGGLAPPGGAAAAETAHAFAAPGESDEQVGLVNGAHLGAPHDVNVTAGAVDGNINVLGVQVPAEDVANDVHVPVLSEGYNAATGVTPDNCASGSVTDGGTVQDH